MTQLDGNNWEILTNAAAEHARRQGEALRMYRPMPTQLPFHASSASERIIRGGNRSGKSTSAAAEFASAVTGIPLADTNGNVLPFQYPAAPTTAWVIGYDQRHIGGTIYRLLFKDDAFKIIRDEKTGNWRAWRPWEQPDLDRLTEIRPAPPFIPPRMILQDEWSWENKADRVFSTCRLKNGSEIKAWSSKGQAGQGVKVDVIWIDEDIEYPQHVGEWQARMSDAGLWSGGRLFWSAWPHSKNDALVRMSERAADQINRKNRDIEEVVLTFSGNPFIPENEKRKRREGWSEEEIRTRDRGEFLTDTILMYPNFSKAIHSIPNLDGNRYSVDDALIGNQVPAHWTHYVVIDPGHTKAAAILASVPPPVIGDFVVVWGEVYQRNSDAEQMAKAITALRSGKEFYAFLMDAHAGQQTPMGFTKTIRQNYAEKFATYGLRSQITGSGFIPGSDNIAARTAQVRDWLVIRPKDGPKLRVVVEACPNLVREFGLYKKRVTQHEITDEPVRRNNDAMNCLEYLAAYNPTYQAVHSPTVHSPAYRLSRQWRDDKEAKYGKSIHLGAGAREPAGMFS